MSDRRDDIEKYLRGELSPSRMHQLEKEALSDPFLAEALEGASAIDHKDFSADVAELNRRTSKKQVLFTPLRIAAGVVLLIGVSLFYVLSPTEETIKIVQEKATEVQGDSVGSAKKDTLLIAAEKPIEKKVEKSKQPEPKQERDQQLTLRSPSPTFFKRDSATIPVEAEMGPAQAAVANPHMVTGKVTIAEDGLPLPGVTVVVKGTTRGTTTDINGNYSLDVPDSTSLVFSFVGMQTNEIAAKDNSSLDVKMIEDVSLLSEVVIARAPLPKDDDETPIVNLAEPAGGIRAYNKYLENSRQYPQQALDNDVKGRVIIGFDVGLNGELSNFKVIRSPGFGCDDEVIRLVKEGAGWTPTTEDSKPVESTVHVKMKFDAVKFKKNKK